MKYELRWMEAAEYKAASASRKHEQTHKTQLTELWNHNKYTALCLFFPLWTHQCTVQQPWRQGWLFLALCHNIYQRWGGLFTSTLCPLMIILLLYFTSNSGGEITASLCSTFVLVVALHYIVNNTVRVFMKLLFVCVANSYGFHWAVLRK